MRILNFVSPLVNQFLSYFTPFFTGQTKPTIKKLYLFIAAMTVTASLSVRKFHTHVISHLSSNSLNSFYYMLSDAGRKLPVDYWTQATVKLALSVVPEDAQHLPILHIGDDTGIQKTGKDMGARTLHDHSGYHKTPQYRGNKGRNGSDFYQGHCFVSTMMMVPARVKEQLSYLPVITGQRMWNGQETKLKMMADMIRLQHDEIGKDRKALSLFDSWFPRGEVAALHEIDNLEILCNAKVNTVMYDPIVPPRTGGPGRPRIYGDRITLDDFELKPVPGTDLSIGYKFVKTNIFGDKIVFAIVTQLGESGEKRLFICTDPSICTAFVEHPELLPEATQELVQIDTNYAPYAAYLLRWIIEKTYQQLKGFWDFTEYRVRREGGITRMVNIQAMLYSVLSLLPALDKRFEPLADMSMQERRWFIGRLISREIFFEELSRLGQTAENSQLSPQLLDEVYRAFTSSDEFAA